MANRGTFYNLQVAPNLPKIKTHTVRAQSEDHISAIQKGVKTFEVRFYSRNCPYKINEGIELFHENVKERALCKIVKIDLFESPELMFKKIDATNVFPAILESKNSYQRSVNTFKGMNSNPESSTCLAMTLLFKEALCLPTQDKHTFDFGQDIQEIIQKRQEYVGCVFRFSCQLMKKDDLLTLYGNDNAIICKITEVKVFNSFDAIFKEIPVDRMFSDLEDNADGTQEALKVLRAKKNQTDVHKLGAVAIKISFVKYVH